jgi:hypothetical protein
VPIGYFFNDSDLKRGNTEIISGGKNVVSGDIKGSKKVCGHTVNYSNSDPNTLSGIIHEKDEEIKRLLDELFKEREQNIELINRILDKK